MNILRHILEQNGIRIALICKLKGIIMIALALHITFDFLIIAVGFYIFAATRGSRNFYPLVAGMIVAFGIMRLYVLLQIFFWIL